MPFKVRAKKREGGGYCLAFGKGGNKLEAEMLPSVPPQPKGKFVVAVPGVEIPYCGMARQCKEYWGEWAEKNYAGENGDDEPGSDELADPPTCGPESIATAINSTPASKPPRATPRSNPDDAKMATRYRAFVTGWVGGPPPQIATRSVEPAQGRIVQKYTLTNGATITISMTPDAVEELVLALASARRQVQGGDPHRTDWRKL